MKRKDGFWNSLEKYGWSVVGRSPLPWAWIGVGIVLSIMVISMVYGGQSVVGARNIEQVIGVAARNGDYETAQKFWSESMVGLEDKVYPERKIEFRIAELEQKLDEYPGNRQIYLALGELYGELGNSERAEEYREKARVLDPNNSIFQP